MDQIIEKRGKETVKICQQNDLSTNAANRSIDPSTILSFANLTNKNS
jgi:hypothetical protein